MLCLVVERCSPELNCIKKKGVPCRNTKASRDEDIGGRIGPTYMTTTLTSYRSVVPDDDHLRGGVIPRLWSERQAAAVLSNLSMAGLSKGTRVPPALDRLL